LIVQQSYAIPPNQLYQITHKMAKTANIATLLQILTLPNR